MKSYSNFDSPSVAAYRASIRQTLQKRDAVYQKHKVPGEWSLILSTLMAGEDEGFTYDKLAALTGLDKDVVIRECLRMVRGDKKSGPLLLTHKGFEGPLEHHLTKAGIDRHHENKRRG